MKFMKLSKVKISSPICRWISVFIPPKSAQVNFLWGKNDVRTVIQQFYTPPKTFIPPKQISGYAPAVAVDLMIPEVISALVSFYVMCATPFLVDRHACFTVGLIGYIFVLTWLTLLSDKYNKLSKADRPAR